MKMNEMHELCDKHKTNCRECPLCIPDKIWQKELISWCLLEMRRITIIQYQNAINENNEVLASKIIKNYQELEKKTLKK